MINKNMFKMKNIRPVLIGLAGYSILQALLIIGQAYYLALSITEVWGGQPLQSQTSHIMLFFGAFMSRQVLNYVKDKVLDAYAFEQASLIRQELLAKVFALGPNFVQKHGTGNMVTMSIEGIAQIENYIQIILPKLTNMMIVPWIILVFVFMQDISSGIVLLVVFPLIIIFMIVLGYAARAKADKQYEGFQRLSNHFLDSLRGLETLNLLGLSKRYEKNVFDVSENYRKATMSTLKIAILSTFALDFFSTLSVAIIALFLGLRLIEAEMLLMPALTVLILAPDFFLPVRDFANDYHATLDGGNTLDSIYTILDEPETKESQALPMTSWEATDKLSLKNVSVQYDARYETRALKEISFDWQGYGKVGIIGLSGSGKSTLIKTLGGFLSPTAESELYINEQRLNTLADAQWQRQLFYIPQDPYLFHASLRDNICFYVPDASEEVIQQAVKQAGLASLVAELPEGLDTMIGDGGQMLSGGQMQRVALARAFVDQERKVLLFDEPTAHLDIETEAELKETMLPLFDNHLVFFATHRLHWMKEMDYILVMDHGEIVEHGTYEALNAKDGYYQAFVKDITQGRDV